MHPFSWVFNLLLLLILPVSWLGTRCMRKLGRRNGWVVQPRPDRWHKEPTAVHGGVGFGLPFLVFSFLFLLVEYPSLREHFFLFQALEPQVSPSTATVLGTGLLFICGLWDDLRAMRPSTKLIWQLGASSLFMYTGGVLPLTDYKIIDLLVTFLWFAGITNAMNMLDNMDGLASGVALLSGAALAFLTWRAVGWTTPALPLILLFLGAVFGFWLHNKPPAKIFMGDSGSLTMGFFLAAVSIPSPMNGYFLSKTSSAPPLGFETLLIPIAAMAVPIFDTLFVMITRTLRAQVVTKGGKDHTSHRLMSLGFSPRRTLALLYGISLFGGLMASLIQTVPQQSIPLFGGFCLFLALVGAYLGRFSDPRAERTDLPFWLRFAGNLDSRQRLGEAIFDAVVVSISFYSAYLLRFELSLDPAMQEAMVRSLPLVVVSSLIALRVAGVYTGTWRLVGLSELPSIALGSFLATVLSLAVVTLFTRFGQGHSRSAFLIFGVLLFLFVSVARVSFRALDDFVQKRAPRPHVKGRRAVLIYGAGKAGRFLCEEILFNPDMSRYRVLGFVDDDPDLAGRKVCGLMVKPKTVWAGELKNSPEIWVSSPTVPSESALTFAARWTPAAEVKRLNVGLEKVGEGGGTCS